MFEQKSARSSFLVLFAGFQSLLVLIAVAAYFLAKRPMPGLPPDPLFVQLSYIVLAIPILLAAFLVQKWIRPTSQTPPEMKGSRLLALSVTTMALTEFPSLLGLAGVGMGFYGFLEFVPIPSCGVLINFMVLLPAGMDRAEKVSGRRPGD